MGTVTAWNQAVTGTKALVSRLRPLARLADVVGSSKPTSEDAPENSTSTAAAESMLKPAGILRNGIQESNVRILKNEIQDDGGNESDDWILKCSKKKKKEPRSGSKKRKTRHVRLRAHAEGDSGRHGAGEEAAGAGRGEARRSGETERGWRNGSRIG